MWLAYDDYLTRRTETYKLINIIDVCMFNLSFNENKYTIYVV